MRGAGREVGEASRIEFLARRYFEYMGEHFPQVCASDEFHFFPRSQAAWSRLHTLDSLSREYVSEHLSFIRGLLGETGKVSPTEREEEIDKSMLENSMRGVLREMGEEKIWEKDATLYLKVPLFATARILAEGEQNGESGSSRLFKLLRQIPPFLMVGLQNMADISAPCLEMAARMAGDAIRFFKKDIKGLVGCNRNGTETAKALQAVVEALELYRERIGRIEGRGRAQAGEERLKSILKGSFGEGRSPKEILEEIEEARRRTQENLSSLRRKEASGSSLFGETGGSQEKEKKSPLDIFRGEVETLRAFFFAQGIIPIPSKDKVKVELTPSYLRSLRTGSSYSAPLLPGKGKGVFYVAPWEWEQSGARILLHSPYLAAHETYPGHHLLDFFRLHNPNPIRSQVESPMFYEGWACYGEQLLEETGYVKGFSQLIVGQERRLWRMMRAKIDVEFHLEMTSWERAAGELIPLGFSKEEALKQVKRFSLTPGYQLCYFVGHREIERLREKARSRWGLKGFHGTLLKGGQMPFHLVEKRLLEKDDGQGSGISR